jgi:hypothetical protein
VPPAPPAGRTGGRKPNGYWNELGNVEAALVEVNALIPGRAGKRIMPTTAEMRALGRSDLLAALAKHKGLKLVAQIIGWSSSSKRAPANAASISASLPVSTSGKSLRRVISYSYSETGTPLTSSAASSADNLFSALFSPQPAHASPPAAFAAIPVRPKILRRPKHYWDDLSKVHSSISGFIAEYGTPGVMPTEREFDRANQSALRQSAQRHGGLAVVAEQMGLKARKAPKSAHIWQDKELFTRSLFAFTEQHDPGVMPTANELKSAGEHQLANAVTVHGGYPAVARSLGLIVRSAKKEGAPETWDEKRLADQLRTFTATFFPGLALGNRLPSEAQLRKCGRNDICYAVSKFGGYKAVQERLGFVPRQVGPRRAASLHDHPASSSSLSS